MCDYCVFYNIVQIIVQTRCRRNICVPLVSPAFRDRRHLAGISGISSMFLQIRRRNACINGSRASRLHAVVLNR
ncbi:MAG: hypothetical protein LBP59_09500 [Planctomycetaceae bacterium]|nr:hypothetical protein [Planctomycetaceae bacterium]